MAERKAKRLAKEGIKKESEKVKTLDTSKPITLDFLLILTKNEHENKKRKVKFSSEKKFKKKKNFPKKE